MKRGRSECARPLEPRRGLKGRKNSTLQRKNPGGFRSTPLATILGIGAHYDDCVFGISGLLLKALRKHHRVVVLSLIGDYRNWKPVQGRERELVDGTVSLGKEYGVECGSSTSPR